MEEKMGRKNQKKQILFGTYNNILLYVLIKDR